MEQMAERLCREELWNSSVSWATADPLLSRCARQSVLRVLPCLLFWMLLPIELLFRPEPRPVRWSWLMMTRMAFALTACALDAAEFVAVLATRGTSDAPPVDLCTPLVASVSFALAAVTLMEGKSKGLVRSFSVWIFAAVSLFMGTINYYHLFKEQAVTFPYEKSIGLAHLPVVAVFFVLCSLADHPDLQQLGDKPAMSDIVSFPYFFTFSFIGSLIYKGFRGKLTIHDLDGTREDDKTRYLGPKLRRNLIAVDEDGNEFSKGVGKALFKTFWPSLLVTGFWKLAYDGFGFVSPLLLHRLLTFLSSDEPVWHGVVIILIMLFGSLGVNLCVNMYMFRAASLGLQVRTSLMCVIYRKALTISNSARRDSTVGEIVNLMSVDCDRFNMLMTWINFTWAGVLQIGIALWLLYNELGYSAFAGLAAMLLVMPVNVWLARIMERAYKEQMTLKDERVKSMNEILGGIKVLKLYAWEKAFMEIVLKIRKSEVRFIRQIAYMNGAFSFSFSITPVLVTLSTFAVYVLSDDKNVLDPAKVFFSMSIFNILRMPLINMPYLFSHMVSTYVSLKRVNKFFSSSDLEQYVSHEPDDEHAVVMESAALSWAEEQNTEFQLQVQRLQCPDWLSGRLLSVLWDQGKALSSQLCWVRCT